MNRRGPKTSAPVFLFYVAELTRVPSLANQALTGRIGILATSATLRIYNKTKILLSSLRFLLFKIRLVAALLLWISFVNRHYTPLAPTSSTGPENPGPPAAT